jgi:hypothetical protein
MTDFAKVPNTRIALAFNAIPSLEHFFRGLQRTHAHFFSPKKRIRIHSERKYVQKLNESDQQKHSDD